MEYKNILTIKKIHQTRYILQHISFLKYKNLIQETLHLFRQCLRLSLECDLYSSNEDWDDIHTFHLHYLSLEFYLQQLTQDLPFSDAKERMTLLQTSIKYGHAFINRMKHLDLLSEHDESKLNKMNSKTQSFSRESKIAQFKLCKELENKITSLNQLCNQCDSENVDEELSRDLVKTTLELQIQKSMECLHSCQEELDLLKKRMEMEMDLKENDSDSGNRVDFKDLKGPLLSKDGTVCLL